MTFAFTICAKFLLLTRNQEFGTLKLITMIYSLTLPFCNTGYKRKQKTFFHIRGYVCACSILCKYIIYDDNYKNVRYTFNLNIFEGDKNALHYIVDKLDVSLILGREFKKCFKMR